MTERPTRGRQRHPTSNARYSFETEGGFHRAVCGNVAVGGAFFRSGFVPEPGQRVVLEACAAESGGIHLVCDVIWALPCPRLDAPETGFGVSFAEVYSTRGAGVLRKFLRDEFGFGSVELVQAERDGRAADAFSFEAAPSPTAPEAVTDPSDDLDQRTVRAIQGPIEEAEFHDVRDAVVSWGNGESRGRLTHLAEAMVRVIVHGTAPSLYEGVTMTPAYPSIHMPSLIMHGTVTGASTLGPGLGIQLAVRVWEIEELDAEATFEAYRELLETEGLE